MLTTLDNRRLSALDVSVVASDFGARPDGSNAAPGFAKAIAELAGRGGGRLIIPKGEYVFEADSGVCLDFNEMNDIAIEAEGAEFIVRGLVRPVSFRKCNNVFFSGLTIRWARPPFSQGDLTEIAQDQLSAVVALDEMTPADGWTNVKALGEYDRATGLIAMHGVDVYDAVTEVEPIDWRHVRLHFNKPLRLTHGSAVVLRHEIYEAHALEMRSCQNVLFQNVTIRSAPGMGFVAALTHNIVVRNCEIAPPPNSGLFMSITADAVHFGNCSGEILIEKSRFAKMGDDGVNVTTSYWRIVERPDPQTMIVKQWRDHMFWQDDSAGTGDLFDVASPATLEPLCQAKIDEAHLVVTAPAPAMELHFAHDVCGASGDLIYDEARSPHLIIRNNRFEDNRARGVIAHRDAVIENNVFMNQSAQAILLSPDAWWMEGPEIKNVRITGNTFDGVDRWGLQQGAIAIFTKSPGLNKTNHTTQCLPTVLVKDNVFKNLRGSDVVCKPSTN